jgi:NADPH:quinone reductase-like Zn-dependent oxidoreductase
MEVIMKAAVVSSFDSAPRYQDFGVPVPAGDDEVLVDVLAAGLHPRVRSQADGSHYTSTDALPLVPGVEGTDPVTVAAAMNPAMSSWVALRQRISFQAGQDVLVLGATGNAGQMAVQVAKRLGAGQIIAAGRDTGRLAALPAVGATATVPLAANDTADRLAKTAADVDVVLDYLWGQPAADAMIAIITSRADRGRPLSWIEIGSVAGPTAPVPSAALRAARLQLVGSGQGSVSTREYLAELNVLAQEIAAGTIAVDARPVPLAHVEEAWAATDANHRLVLVP